MTRITRQMLLSVLETLVSDPKRERIPKEILDHHFKMLQKALSLRKEEERLHLQAHYLSDDVVLDYSSDPWDVLRMSAGKFKPLSSMNLFGSYNRGVYDDIEKSSVLAILTKPGTKPTPAPGWYARLILRWCRPPGGKKKMIGMESRFYSAWANSSAEVNSEKLVAPGLPASRVTSSIKKQLADAGMLDYDVCITEDKYEGYSDVAGSSDVKIRYRP